MICLSYWCCLGWLPPAASLSSSLSAGRANKRGMFCTRRFLTSPLSSAVLPGQKHSEGVVRTRSVLVQTFHLISFGVLQLISPAEANTGSLLSVLVHAVHLMSSGKANTGDGLRRILTDLCLSSDFARQGRHWEWSMRVPCWSVLVSQLISPGKVDTGNGICAFLADQCWFRS